MNRAEAAQAVGLVNTGVLAKGAGVIEGRRVVVGLGLGVVEGCRVGLGHVFGLLSRK